VADNNQQNSRSAQDAANAASRQARSTEDIRQNLVEILALQRDYAEEAKKAAKAVFDSNIQASAAASAFRDIASATRNIESTFSDVIKGQKTLAQVQKDIAKSEKAKNSLLTETRQALNKIGFSQDEITQALTTQEGIYQLLNNSSILLNNEQFDLLDLYARQLDVLDEQVADMSEIQSRAQNIDDAFGLAGGSAEVLSSALGKLGGSKFSQMLGIDDAVSDTREFAAGITEGGTKAAGLGDKFKIAGNLAKNLGQNLTKALGPVALITMAVEKLIEAFQKIDNAAGDTAKELGISYQSARSLVGEMNSVAMASNDIMVSTENLVKAQTSLNQLMGTSVQFSGQMAEEFSSIQQRLKLSDGAMATFTKLSLQNGQSLKENLASVSKTTLALNSQNKISLSQKTIQEAIGKTSSATRLTLGNSVTELTKAAIQAKKLGVEIEDLGKTSSALLDFESSISSELEAELLTGKNLNLERARLAALNGDIATVAEEISKQIGTSAEFSKMNVIQQEALAKSMGMNREDMASMLENQENLNNVQKLGFKDLNSAQEEYNKMVAAGASQSELDAKFKDKALKSQLESVSTQERLSAVTSKLQEAFIALVEPLMPVLDVLTEILEGVVKPIMMIVGPLIKELSTGLMDAFSPIKEIFSDIQGIMTDLLGDSNELSSVFTIIGKTLGALLKVVFVPLKAAINFAVTGVKSLVDIVGGLVDIFQGNFSEGFHKIIEGVLTMMLSPFQLIADLAVGTINAVISGINNIPGVDINPIELDLAKTISGAIPFAEGGIVNRPTNALIGEAGAEAVIPLDKLMAEFKEMRAILTQIANREGTVYLDGTKVGTAMAMSTYKTQ